MAWTSVAVSELQAMRRPTECGTATVRVPRFFIVPISKLLSTRRRNPLLTKLISFMENKKMEELQSRREFFKEAAKSALPVLGVAVFGTSLLTSCSERNTPSGCGKSCSGSCEGDCAGDCDDGCWTACISACVHYQR